MVTLISATGLLIFLAVSSLVGDPGVAVASGDSFLSSTQRAGLVQASDSSREAGLVEQTGTLEADGGLAFTYEISCPEGAVNRETLKTVVQVLQRRLDGFGIAGARIVIGTEQRIVVALPPVAGPQDVVDSVSALNLIEFIDPMGQYLPEGTLVTTSLGGPETGDPGLLNQEPLSDTTYQTIVSGSDVASAYLTPDQAIGADVVAFELTEAAGDALFEFTSTHIGEPMSIVLDKRVLLTPTIYEAIATEGVIPGLEPREAAFLVASLDAGPLPAPLQLVSSRRVSVVGPSGATIYDTPSQLGRGSVELPAGTLLMWAGPSETGPDGHSWAAVQTLSGSSIGYVRVESLN